MYEESRKNCGAKSKLLEADKFVNFACKKILNKGWSPDAIVGFVKQQLHWQDKPIVSTKTHYNYIDQSLLSFRDIDLPMKTKLNTKPKPVAQKNRKVLGQAFRSDRLKLKTEWNLANGKLTALKVISQTIMCY